MTTVELTFDLKTKVHIDGDKDIIGVITGYLLRVQGPQYEVSWFHNGAQHTAWIDEFRLTPAEP